MMGVLNGSRESFLLDEEEVVTKESLREERRKTGRYLAAGIVILLVLLGLYHAVLYRSPKLSALFGAALIMFLYLLWVLYASQRKKRRIKIDLSSAQRDLEEVAVHGEKSKDKREREGPKGKSGGKPENEGTCGRPVLCRSYSIA